MCVPTIAIAYSHKAPGVMKMIGLEKYVCNFETMTSEELKSKVDDILINKERIKTDLALIMPSLKESAWNSGKIVKEIIAS